VRWTAVTAAGVLSASAREPGPTRTVLPSLGSVTRAYLASRVLAGLRAQLKRSTVGFGSIS
jgi:hypothetical protein